jgi:hypothetical protein
MSFEVVCHELDTKSYYKVITNLEGVSGESKFLEERILKIGYEKVFSLEWGWSTAKKLPLGSNNIFVFSGGNDRSVTSWDSAKDFEKLLQVKLSEGVGSPK